MKKHLIMALMAMFAAFTVCSCGDDDATDSVSGGNNSSSSQSGSKSIIGTWDMPGLGDGEFSQMIITEKGYTVINEYSKTEGTYTMSNGVFTLTSTKFYLAELDDNERPIPGKWNEAQIPDDMKKPGKAKIKLLEDANVLVIEEEGQEPMMLYRKDAKIQATANSLQGKWIWWLDEGKTMVRAYIEFSGNKYDFVVAAWRQRYQGTFTYANGVVTCKVDKFTKRDWDPNISESVTLKYENLFQWWRELTPEEKEEESKYPDWNEATFGYSTFTFPMVVDNKTAYSLLPTGGMSITYEKQ